MKFEEASKIVEIWGKYLEYTHGRLNLIFLARIPESFLPFPQKTLEEAVNIVAERYHNDGDQDAVRILQSTLGLLVGYTNDKEAVLNAVKFLDDPMSREALLLSLKHFQRDWIKTQQGF